MRSDSLNRREKKKNSSRFFLPKSVLGFLILLSAGVLLWLLPFFYDLFPKAALFFYVMHAYIVTPAAAAVLPFLLKKFGMHPFAAFFPIGCSLLFSPHFFSPAIGILCLVLSLVSAVAGQEWEKRKNEKMRKGEKRVGNKSKE